MPTMHNSPADALRHRSYSFPSPGREEIYTEGFQATLRLLSILTDGIPVPFVKSILLTGLEIIRMADEVKNNKLACQALGAEVEEVVFSIISVTEGKSKEDLDCELTPKILRFGIILQEVSEAVARISDRSAAFRWISSAADTRQIWECKERLSSAFRLFQTELSLHGCIMTSRRHEELLRQFGHLGEQIKLLEPIQLSRVRAIADTWNEDLPSSSLPTAALPPRPKNFVGRSKVVDPMTELICDLRNPARIAILGAPGVGKTSVLLDVLHDPKVVNVFERRRHFIACDSLSASLDILSALARELEISGKNLQRRIIERLREAPTLIAFDNFESPWESLSSRMETETFLSMLADISTCVLIVTMRGAERPSMMTWTSGIDPVLSPLSEDDSREVFVAISGCASDDPHLPKLLSALEGLPLAINLMANLASYEPLETLVYRWDTERTSMLSNSVASRHYDIDVSISISVESERLKASPNAKKLLSVLALLPNGLLIPSVFEAFPNAEDIGRCISTLLASATVYRDGSNRLRILAPIREHLLARTTPDPDWSRDLEQAYFDLAKLGADITVADSTDGIQEVSFEIGNMHAVIRHAFERGSQLVDAVNATINLATFQEWRRIGSPRTLQLALEVCRGLKNDKLLADVSFKLGSLLRYLQAPAAECEQLLLDAFNIYRRSADVQGQALVLCRLGQHVQATDLYQAEVYLTEAARLSAHSPCTPYEHVTCLYKLARVLTWKRDLVAAQECADKASSVMSLNKLNCAFPLELQARLDLKFNRFHDVITNATEAAEQYKLQGEIWPEANCYQLLGQANLWSYQFEAARASFTKGLTVISAHEGHSITEAWCIKGLGTIAFNTGNVNEASKLYLRAQRIFDLFGQKYFSSRCEMWLGDVAFKKNDFKTARMKYLQCLTFHNHDMMGSQTRCIMRLGDTAMAVGDDQEATNQYVLSFAMASKCKVPFIIAATISRLADLTSRSYYDTDAALTCYEISLKLAREISALDTMAKCLESMANLTLRKFAHESVNEIKEAKAWLVEARDLYAKMRDEPARGRCVRLLASLPT